MCITVSYEEKCGWLRRNPVTAARHFQYRLSTFFQDVLKSNAKPLGEIVEYGIRVEFQARGSQHAHCVLWVKDAPKYGVASNADVWISLISMCPVQSQLKSVNCIAATAA